MNLSVVKPPSKRTPPQMASYNYDILKRRILKIDAKGSRLVPIKARLQKDFGLSTAEKAILNDKLTLDFLAKIQKPKTNIETAKKTKLSMSASYSALNRLVSLGQVKKLKFNIKSNSRFLYVFAEVSFDKTKFVEVVA